MNRIVGVTNLQRNFRLIFDQVAYEKIPYVLTRGSRPEAALIPYDDFLYLQQLRETQVLARFNRLLAKMAEVNVAFNEREVEEDLIRAEAELE